MRMFLEATSSKAALDRFRSTCDMGPPLADPNPPERWHVPLVLHVVTGSYPSALAAPQRNM